MSRSHEMVCFQHCTVLSTNSGCLDGIVNQTSLQRVPKEYGGKGEMYGECTTAQVRMPVATMEQSFTRISALQLFLQYFKIMPLKK